MEICHILNEYLQKMRHKVKFVLFVCNANLLNCVDGAKIGLYFLTTQQAFYVLQHKRDIRGEFSNSLSLSPQSTKPLTEVTKISDEGRKSRIKQQRGTKKAARVNIYLRGSL